jgi:hypothetical protein
MVMNDLLEKFMVSFKEKNIFGYQLVNDSNDVVSSILRSELLNNDLQAILQDETGSLIAVWKIDDQQNPIVYLDSEGGTFAILAENFERFLSLLYYGTYGSLELIHYLDYLKIKSIYENLGAEFTEPTPSGMSPKELQDIMEKNMRDYEDSSFVFKWLEDNKISPPASLFEAVITAYENAPNFDDFLNERIGPAT